MAAHSRRLACRNLRVSRACPVAEQTGRSEVSDHSGKSVDRRPIGARRPAKAWCNKAIHFRCKDFGQPQSLASGFYRFLSRLRRLHLQLLAATSNEVSLWRAVQHCNRHRGHDPQFAWADRDGPRVPTLRPHSRTPISSSNSGCSGGNCLPASRSTSLALLLCCSFFGCRSRNLQLFAHLFLVAGRIPDRSLGRCWYCARDICGQLRRLRGAIYRRTHSPKDGQLLLRPDLRRNFFPCRGGFGLFSIQATLACWPTISGGDVDLETSPEALVEES